jgi:hypothetical protein
MPQIGEHDRFAHEPSAAALARSGEHFQGHVRIAQTVAGLPDFPHPS